MFTEYLLYGNKIQAMNNLQEQHSLHDYYPGNEMEKTKTRLTR